MNYPLALILTLAAAVCLAVALLISVTSLGGNFDAWLAGGLLAYVLGVLAGSLPARQP